MARYSLRRALEYYFFRRQDSRRDDLSVSPTTIGAIVGDRGRFPTATLSLANLAAGQIAHTAPSAGAISDIVFTDVWWYIADTFLIQLLAAPLTIKKYVEYPQGTFTQVLWAGASTVTLSTTARNVTSDPVAVSIPAGAQWWEHTINQSGTVGFAMRELPANASVLGVLDAKYTSVAGAPAHQSAGQASLTNFGSALVTGTVAAAGYMSPYVFGDSIAWGEGDISTNGVGARGSSGYLGRKFDSMGVGYSMCAKRGISLSDFATLLSAASPTIDPFISLVRAAATHIIVQAGVNDLRLGRTEAQVLASLQTIYGKFTGKGVIQTTITPRSTTNDAYATVINQTARTDGNWSSLTAVNTDIRAGLANVTFVMESADSAMSARDSGVWTLAAGVPTIDGTHPTSAMAAYMAANTPLTLA